MPEPQLVRVQGLPWKIDRPQRVGPINIPRFANKCMSVQPSLEPNLVAAAGDQAAGGPAAGDPAAGDPERRNSPCC